MRSNLRAIGFIVAILVVVTSFAGCRQANRVSHNLSLEADSFNVVRKITVINVRTNDIIFQMTGNFSILNETEGELSVVGEEPNGRYYKHFIRLADEVTYVVEDMGGTGVDKHKYEINFNPKMLIPVTPVITD